MPESGGGDFTNDSVGRGTDRAIVDKVEEDEEGTGSHLGLLVRVECHGSDNIQDLPGSGRGLEIRYMGREVRGDATHNCHADHSCGEDGTSTEEGHQDPRRGGTDDEHRIEDHVERE